MSIKERKLMLQLQIFSEESSMFNKNVKQVEEMKMRTKKILEENNKESPLFWKSVDQLTDEVKTLISETEILNMKELEKQEVIINSFPKPKMANQLFNHIGAAIISNVVDPKLGLFNIITIEDEQNMPRMNLTQLDPLPNEPFIGSLLVWKTEHGSLLRCIRVSIGTEKIIGNRNIKLMLLETGETTYVKFNMTDFFEMPMNYKKMPALSHLCKLVDYDANVEDFVNANSQKRIDYKVVGVDKTGAVSKLYDVLLIKLLPALNITEETNPFLTDSEWAGNVTYSETQYKIVFPEIGSIMWIEPLQVYGINRLYAHYIPISDIKHEFELITNPKNTTVIPTLTQLTLLINSEKDLKPYNNEKKGEMVLALHDDIFYRAKIVSKEDESCVVFFVDYGSQKKVQNSNIRQFDNKFSVLPFQAILLRIGNIQPDENKDKNQEELGIQLLTHLIRKKPCAAILLKVVNDGEYAEVRIIDKTGEDVGEILVKEGYAKSRL